VSATATDAENRLARVEFYSGTTLIGSVSAAPFTTTWSAVAAGNYSITAKAIDLDGGTATSAAATISVQSSANQLPTVALTAPVAGASITAPATVALTATASDPEGRMARVEFYVGATLIGTDTTSPYAASWSASAAGTYAIKAIAFDADGGSRTSTIVNVTVTAVSTQPKTVMFGASPDHSTTLVTSYLLEVFANGANPLTATPVSSSDMGKPTPAANNDISVDRATFFAALPTGTYVATVSAIGPGGKGSSAALTFSR
jgi:chitinase